MDGIHDVGGMDGFGDLPPDEPDDASPFHEGWEGRVQAAYIAGLGNDVFNLDQFRHTLERHEPTYYLETPYYERWLTGVSELYVDAGVISEAELRERTEAFEAGEAEMPDDGGPSLDELVPGVADHYRSERPDRAVDPAFEVGDRVRVLKKHPSGHTRCPRYVRGATGEIVAQRGTHVSPDAHAHGEDAVEPLYNVKFDAADLWGEENTDADTIRIELWERYIEAEHE